MLSALELTCVVFYINIILHLATSGTKKALNLVFVIKQGLAFDIRHGEHL